MNTLGLKRVTMGFEASVGASFAIGPGAGVALKDVLKANAMQNVTNDITVCLN